MSLLEGERLQETSPWGQLFPKRWHPRYSSLPLPRQPPPQTGAPPSDLELLWPFASRGGSCNSEDHIRQPPTLWPAPPQALGQQTQVSQHVTVWGAWQTASRAGRGSLPWPPFITRATTTGMGDTAGCWPAKSQPWLWMPLDGIPLLVLFLEQLAGGSAVLYRLHLRSCLRDLDTCCPLQ